MITPWEILRRVQPLEVIAKAVAVTLAYLLGFAITSHFHEASSLTGTMLACVSAIVVQQQPDIRHAVQQGGCGCWAPSSVRSWPMSIW